MLRRCVLGAFLAVALAGLARADFVVINFGGRSLALQGKYEVSGKVVLFTHPTLNKTLVFPLDPSRIKLVRTPTLTQQYNKMVVKAGQDADQVFKSGIWALKKGLLKQFDDAVDKTLKIDAEHGQAKKILEIQKAMDAELPDDPQVEQELKAMIPRSAFRITKSKHFILLHDTPEKPAAGQKKNLANKRLELLEQVYESFLLLFLAQDVEIDIPKTRMKVILFNEYQDYRDFSDALSPSLASASGFWEPERNVSVFFAHGSTPVHRVLTRFQSDLKKMADEAKKARAPGTAELVRLVGTLDLLIEMDRENSDITVVSHEGTHQMAGNTGLFPRHVLVPSWVHEGLATYFEAPADATWAGIGAVNQERIEFYRALETDREHSNIDFIVGDQIFDYAATLGAKLHGYAQAWALTHFLMENHIKEFVEYYRILGEMPPDVRLNPELLTQLFNKVFGVDRKQLDQEWRAYMRTLRTDLENLEDEGTALGANN